MKKLICMALAILLCVGCAAMAMAASSKTTSNMTNSFFIRNTSHDARISAL